MGEHFPDTRYGSKQAFEARGCESSAIAQPGRALRLNRRARRGAGEVHELRSALYGQAAAASSRTQDRNGAVCGARGALTSDRRAGWPSPTEASAHRSPRAGNRPGGHARGGALSGE